MYLLQQVGAVISRRQKFANAILWQWLFVCGEEIINLSEQKAFQDIEQAGSSLEDNGKKVHDDEIIVIMTLRSTIITLVVMKGLKI